MGDAVLEVDAQVAVEPGEGEEGAGGDEVVPGGEAEVAVDEEEDDEDEAGDEVRKFEPLVAELADGAEGGEGEPCLG